MVQVMRKIRYLMRYLVPLSQEAIRIIILYKNWFEIVSNRFGGNKDTTEVTLRSGIKYKIHPSPRSTDIDLIHEIHSENIYQVQKGDISDNSVVIDIGAQIGVFSVFAATQAENVSVYSFEPEPENFQFLVRNIEINHLDNKIHPINQAVSNVGTPKKLIRSAASVSAHSLFPGKFTAGEIRDSIKVDCTTLTDVFRKYAIKKCRILKLDCEGEEYNILLSMPDNILAKVVKIVIEYHDGLTEHTHNDLGEFLRAKNFEVEVREERSFPKFTVGFLQAVNKSSKAANAAK